MRRVQRLLNVEQTPKNPSLNWLTVVVTLGVVAGLAVPFLRQSADAQKSAAVGASDTAEIRLTLVGDVTPEFGPESIGFTVNNSESYAVFEVVQDGESRKMEFVYNETPQGSRYRVETRSKQFLNGAENSDNWIMWFVDYLNKIGFLETFQTNTTNGVATGKLENDKTFTVLKLKSASDFSKELENNKDIREKLAKQALDHGVVDEAGYKLLLKMGSS